MKLMIKAALKIKYGIITPEISILVNLSASDVGNIVDGVERSSFNIPYNIPIYKN